MFTLFQSVGDYTLRAKSSKPNNRKRVNYLSCVCPKHNPTKIW